MEKVKIPSINFESEIFYSTRNSLNFAIKSILEKCYSREFESGDVTIKINISVLDDYVELPAEDETGEISSALYEYRRPAFKSSIGTSLKKTSKREECYFPNAELKKVDDDFALFELPKAQIELQDLYSEFDLDN